MVTVISTSNKACSNQKNGDALTNNDHERKEVLLNHGDGILDAGLLTKSKNAVCYIYCSKEETEKRGSGFFALITLSGIEHKVIITNNHVLCNKEEAACAVARFHYEGKLPGADIRLKPELMFHTNDVLDYTIIGCDADTIENRFCIDPIEFTEEDPMSVGDDIFIFQHPKGDTKKFSYQKISRIERPYVYYNADTDIGSSGSVVLRKFKLIAVHSKGSDLLQYNKGTLCSEILHHLRTGTYTQPASFSSESACQKKKRKSDVLGELETANKRSRDTDNTLQQNTFNDHHMNTVKPTEDQLADLSKEIVAYWKHLARKLKLPNCEVQRIQKDHVNYDDITEKANAMLLTWLELDTNAYVSTLRDALISLGKKDTAVRHFPM